MTKILVTGAAGLVGRQITKDLVEKNIEVYSCYNELRPDFGIPIYLDLLKQHKIGEVVQEIKPDIIIHLAAITDVEKCEKQKELTRLINVESTEILAKESVKHDAFFVYISTDYVFDGEKGMKNESDNTNPLNYYGKSKLDGENVLRKLTSQYAILRTSTPFGFHPKKRSFPLWIINNLKLNNEIPVLTDQFTSPTFVPNLSKMIIEVSIERISGILHLAGASRISRFDFAKMIAQRLNLNETLLKPSKIEDIKWNARRPKDSSLDVSKAKKFLKNKPQNIEQYLESFVEQFKET